MGRTGAHHGSEAAEHGDRNPRHKAPYHSLMSSSLITTARYLRHINAIVPVAPKETKAAFCSPSLGACSGQSPTCSKGPPHPALSLCCGRCGSPAAPCSFAACQLHTQAPAPGEDNTQPPGPQDGGLRSSRRAEIRTCGDDCAEQITTMVRL